MEIKQEKNKKKNTTTHAANENKTNSSDHRPPSVLVSLLFGLRIPFVVFGAQHTPRPGSHSSGLFVVIARTDDQRQTTKSGRRDKKKKKIKKKPLTLTVKLFKRFKAPPGGGTGPSAVCSYQKVHFGKVETGTAPDENSCQFSFDVSVGDTRLAALVPSTNLSGIYFARRGNVTKNAILHWKYVLVTYVWKRCHCVV